MKHKSILSLFIFLLGLGSVTTSCEDMLTPDMDRYAENFSGKDTVYFYLGILRNVQDMVEQNELLSDMRSDLVTTTEYSSDSVSNIINYRRQADGENALLNRSAYYKVINQCNFYLAKADTTLVKNNVYTMRKEYAQVVAIRSWAYIQLVQTYGRVPFVSKPVDNASTGWETNPEAWATADNLVDLLKADMEKAKVYEHVYGYPRYGNYNTGYANIDSRYLCFYNDLVLGDLYLLRGASRSDYVEAAKNYYYYLKNAARNGQGISYSGTADFYKMTNTATGASSYTPSVSFYLSQAGMNGSVVSRNENITVIPSAANNSFGKTLLRIPQICGFDPRSTNSTSTDDSGEESVTTTSGYISLTTNYKSRQVAPSEAFINLCKSQVYRVVSDDETDVEYYEGVGDARLHASAPIVRTRVDGQKGRYINKFSGLSNVDTEGESNSIPTFRYNHSIYRLTQVYLRFAEALNRAGYPRLAFVVLRDGLDYQKLPKLKEVMTYDDENKTKQLTFELDGSEYDNLISNAEYVGVDELRRMEADPEFDLYLDFTSSTWDNIGIHDRGCGRSNKFDSVYVYNLVVAQRIEDEARRTGTLTPEVMKKVQDLRDSFHAGNKGDEGSDEGNKDDNEGDNEGEEGGDEPEPDRSEYTEIDPVPAAEADPFEINAVETLIADECALEMAYEGVRMFDLIRFARHKDLDNSGLFAPNYGTQWLAWLVARRNVKAAPYENSSSYDNALYGLLLDPANWYIASPVY